MDAGQESIQMHKKYQGKLGTSLKVPLRDRHDLSVAYTPGVAEPCLAIQENRDLSFEYTCRGNMIAIVTDGTRVLGLGDIGPEAAMPVMEGKAVLFKAFGDVDAIPICLKTKDKEEIIETVKRLESTFGGINLEDLSSPKCYDIEDELIEALDIPVFHDDQHGTAIAALSALFGALRLVKKDIQTVKAVVNGAGAAGTAIGRLLVSAGCRNVLILNSKGILHQGTPNLDRIQQHLVSLTNPQGVTGGLAEAVQQADVLIGVSAAKAFTADIIHRMNADAIVFALANPVPEISYEEGKTAGARVVGTGRSDAPNQVNNVTVFPGLFRGALDVRARRINEEMKLAAAHAIANLIPDQELKEDYIVPDAFDPRVAPAVAAAVAEAAIKTGVARIQADTEEIRAKAMARIQRKAL